MLHQYGSFIYQLAQAFILGNEGHDGITSVHLADRVPHLDFIGPIPHPNLLEGQAPRVQVSRDEVIHNRVHYRHGNLRCRSYIEDLV